MKQKVIAIFDIGKTNKKLFLFNEKFRVVFQHEEPFPVITDEDGFECDDIDIITGWIRDKLHSLADSSEFDVLAVNFSTYGASLIFTGKDGKRLSPLYNYLKPIDNGIAEELYSRYGGKEEFCRITASPALGLLLNSGIQVLWFDKEKRKPSDEVRNILHFPQYLSFTLSGEILSEPTSLGCHTMMWDFDNMAYHKWVNDYSLPLPEPVNNDTLYGTVTGGKNIFVGTGIHDSSSSLVPYLKNSKEKFILASTGTWSITMNPFNREPLTADQLAQDCLCYLTPEKQQVKSSRLFMGHFHEVCAKRLSIFFNKPFDCFKGMKYSDSLVDVLANRFNSGQLFFPEGKENGEATLKKVDLTTFTCYEEAYTKFMIDLTELFITSYRLVVAAKDDTRIVFLTGGFIRNEIFVELVKTALPDKKVVTSEIDCSTALGAALVIGNVFENPGYSDLTI